MTSAPPWRYEPARPAGWHVVDAHGEQVALVETEDDARWIVEMRNARDCSQTESAQLALAREWEMAS